MKKYLLLATITAVILIGCNFRTHNPTSDQERIDLSILTPDEVYSEILEIERDPTSYIGKDIKIKGKYMPYSNEDGAPYIPACLIPDSMGNYEHGLKFVIASGEYPEIGREIVIQGTFIDSGEGFDSPARYRLEDTVVF